MNTVAPILCASAYVNARSNPIGVPDSTLDPPVIEYTPEVPRILDVGTSFLTLKVGASFLTRAVGMAIEAQTRERLR